MKNFLKSTKWWMYLPFACMFGFSMINWVFKGENQIVRGNRMILLLFNLMITTIFLLIGFITFLYNRNILIP